MKHRILVAALTLTLACAAADGNWPQFRGPSGSGLGDGSNPPVQWDVAKGTNIVWTSEIPGLAVSSPVVWGGRIFVTTAVSADPNQKWRTGLYGDTDSAPDRSSHQWKVLALDKKTGKVLWEQSAHQGIPKTKRHPKSSQASPSPSRMERWLSPTSARRASMPIRSRESFFGTRIWAFKTPDGSSIPIPNGALPAHR
jgi:hypothetical protein